ncbi:MAG: hypothetical protein ABFS56_28475 [Pseudomonadota bacterium]
MSIETGIANTTTAASQGLTATTGTVKAFLLAHPVGIAVVGGALVGTGTYYLMGKLLKKKEEPAAA